MLPLLIFWHIFVELIVLCFDKSECTYYLGFAMVPSWFSRSAENIVRVALQQARWNLLRFPRQLTAKQQAILPNIQKRHITYSWPLYTKCQYFGISFYEKCGFVGKSAKVWVGRGCGLPFIAKWVDHYFAQKAKSKLNCWPIFIDTMP